MWDKQRIFYGIYLVFLYLLSVSIVSSKSENLIVTKQGIYENAVALIPRTLKKIALKVFNGTFPDEFVDFYAPVNAVGTLCRNESLHYKNSLKNFDPWALTMWDSSAKIPIGMMHSHFFDLGNYPECLEVPETGPYDVKYCLIRIGNWADVWNTGFDWINKETIFYGSARVIKPEFYLARCLPASCDNEDIKTHFSDFVKEYNFTIKLDEFSCTASNENEPLTRLDWFVLIFIPLTAIVVLLSALIDLFFPKEIKQGVVVQYILCFSLTSNVKTLVSKPDPTRTLKVINGLRTVAMTLIMWGHIGANLGSTPKLNSLQLIKEHYSPTFRLAFYGVCNSAVDVFFVISGLLISYMVIYYKKSGKKFNIIYYYFNRIIRIIPPYATQIAILVTVLYRFLGSGPLWKHNWGIVRNVCIQNWWSNLLFINNIVHKDEMCIATSWYMAVDTQLYVIAPLILFPMIKYDAFRKFGTPILILLSDSYTFYLSYVNEYRAGSLFEHDMRTERTNETIYTSTHGRFGCWILGLYLGYYMQELELRSKKIQIPKLTLWVCWSLTVILPIIQLGFMMYFMSDHKFYAIVHALYNGYHRTIFATAICWIILACEIGYGGILHTVLSSYPMQILGRITYSAYLVQEGFLYGIDSLTYTSLQYHTLKELRDGLANVVICFGIAFAYHLFFEAPYVNLGKLIIGGAKKPKPEVELTPKVVEDNGVDIRLESKINGV